MSFKGLRRPVGRHLQGCGVKHADTAGRFARLKLIGSELGESIGAKLHCRLPGLLGSCSTGVGPALSKAGGWIKTNLVPPLQAVGGFIKSRCCPRSLSSMAGQQSDRPLAAFAGWIKGQGCARHSRGGVLYRAARRSR